MQGFVVGGVIAVLLFCSAVYCQYDTFYPIRADGWDTAWVDDMSFATELHLQSFPPNNYSMFVYGSGRLRSILPPPPGSNYGYVVGRTPNERWDLPWIDLQVVQNGTDLWGFGPVNPVGPPRGFGGYSLDIAMLTTKYLENYADWRFSPLSFAGSFYAVRPVYFPLGNNIVAYFVGFFPNFTDPFQPLQYGVVRARFNMTNDSPSTNYTDHWAFNASTDVAVLDGNARFVAFSSLYKPMIHHVWNLSEAANPNTTYTIVVEPGTYWVDLVIGNIDPTVPLALSPLNWYPGHIGLYNSYISSSAIYWNHSTLILGLAINGIGTGAIAFVHAVNLTTRGVLYLPANFSDPKALAVDQENHTLYVGMNGGYAALRIDIHNMTITGWQNIPIYLTRAWVGQTTFEHVFFVSNEQHTKVFRTNKHDFCPSLCPEFGYCERGSCQCSPGFQLRDNKCEWTALINEKHTVSKEKTGEAVLGVFFALSFVAAGIAWFLVWKNRRGAYQAV